MFQCGVSIYDVLAVMGVFDDSELVANCFFISSVVFVYASVCLYVNHVIVFTNLYVGLIFKFLYS